MIHILDTDNFVEKVRDAYLPSNFFHEITFYFFISHW